MDTRMNYSELIKKVLQEYREFFKGNAPLRTLFDETQKSYLLLDTGWYGDEYVHDVLIHIDLIHNKIWIQCDNTEEGIATHLLEAGVPANDIVLGFRHPKVRPYTEFAVG